MRKVDVNLTHILLAQARLDHLIDGKQYEALLGRYENMTGHTASLRARESHAGIR